MNGDGIPDVLAEDQMGFGPYPYSDGKGGFTFKQAMPPDPGGIGNPYVVPVTGSNSTAQAVDVTLTAPLSVQVAQTQPETQHRKH